MPRVNLQTRSRREEARMNFRATVKRYEILSGHEKNVFELLGMCKRTYNSRLSNPARLTIGEAVKISSVIGYPIDEMMKLLGECV